jgi:hypothetical protein
MRLPSPPLGIFEARERSLGGAHTLSKLPYEGVPSTVRREVTLQQSNPFLEAINTLYHMCPAGLAALRATAVECRCREEAALCLWVLAVFNAGSQLLLLDREQLMELCIFTFPSSFCNERISCRMGDSAVEQAVSGSRSVAGHRKDWLTER